MKDLIKKRRETNNYPHGDLEHGVPEGRIRLRDRKSAVLNILVYKASF